MQRYSMWDAWDDYRHGAAYNFCLAVNAGGSEGLEADEAAMALARVLVQRAVAAVREIDGCEALL